MPEVGRRFCDYFDPEDLEDMARVLGRLMRDEDYLKARTNEIERSQLITWKDSTKFMMAALDKLFSPEEPIEFVKSVCVPNVQEKTSGFSVPLSE
jgi:hypothetical protein